MDTDEDLLGAIKSGADEEGGLNVHKNSAYPIVLLPVERRGPFTERLLCRSQTQVLCKVVIFVCHKAVRDLFCCREMWDTEVNSTEVLFRK